MALLALPNPTKSITFNFSKVAVETAINTALTLAEMSKYKFQSKNDILGEWTFHSFEFLSVGVNVVINISDIAENKTNVSIEVQRVIGTFDQFYEVDRAKNHLTNWFTAIGKMLTTPYVAPPTYNTVCPHCQTEFVGTKHNVTYTCNKCNGYFKLDENNVGVVADAPVAKPEVKQNPGCLIATIIICIIGLAVLFTLV